MNLDGQRQRPVITSVGFKTKIQLIPRGIVKFIVLTTQLLFAGIPLNILL